MVRIRNLAVLIFALFIAVLTVNYFRAELFGIIPGYAPHNFGFNMLFFIPVNIFLMFCSLFVVIKTASSLSDKSDRDLKVQSLCLTLPILALMMFQLIRSLPK